MHPQANATQNQASYLAGWNRTQLALFCAIFCLGTWWLYKDVFQWLFQVWGSNPDYSHGYFIVPISASYLIANVNVNGSNVPLDERKRTFIPVLAVSLLALALGVHGFGILLGSNTVQGISLLVYIAGLLILLGVHSIIKVMVAVAYLLFMLPLPSYIAGSLSGSLQSLATSISTIAIQILGIPAVAEGNVIQLSHAQIGVAEACSGVRMLYSFVALTLATCMFVERGPLEKVVIAVSAIPIAIAVNCLRIVATAVAHEYIDSETANRIFHDYAGWAMMPVGFLLLFGLLMLLEKLVLEREPMGKSSN